MKPLLLGFTGKAEHGKTQACATIKQWVEDNGGSAAVFEISQLILEHCYNGGLIKRGEKRDQQNKEQNKILVDEGTRMRAVNPNHWTDLVVKQMLESGVDVAMCPNVRFPQEADAIRKEGGSIIRVNRVNKDGSKFVSETRDPNHPCETALDFWPADYFLVNVTGHGALLDELVMTLYEYILGLEGR